MTPLKSAFVMSGNAIFLESLSCHQGNNNFLLATLAPWTFHMNVHCTPSQCRAYVDENWIGSPPLATNDPLLLYMMCGMALLARNVGVQYNVIKVLDLNST